MTRLTLKLEDLFIDIAIAEERICEPKGGTRKGMLRRVEESLAAAAYAEVGDFTTAEELLRDESVDRLSGTAEGGRWLCPDICEIGAHTGSLGSGRLGRAH